PIWRARHADGEEPGAERMLTEEERGSPGRAALLGVEVGEQRALLGDAIDVGGAVTHATQAVGADVVDADVVAPDDEDVGLERLLCERRADAEGDKHNTQHCDGNGRSMEHSRHVCPLLRDGPGSMLDPCSPWSCPL